jgi:hypothetical protein
MIHGASTAKVLSTAEMTAVKIKTSLKVVGGELRDSLRTHAARLWKLSSRRPPREMLDVLALLNSRLEQLHYTKAPRTSSPTTSPSPRQDKKLMANEKRDHENCQLKLELA